MIYVGDPYPLSVTVKDADGTLANAGNMALVITGPTTGTVIDPVAPSSTGVYEYDYTPTEPGRFEYRWVATGANARTLEDVFNVEQALTGAIVSLAEVKSHLNLTSTTDDEELRAAILSASRRVEHIIGPVARRTVVETVIPQGGRLFLSQSPVISLTSIVGAYGYGGTWVVGSLYLDTDNGIVDTGYGVPFGRAVVVTYVAGRLVVEPDIRDATLDLVSWLWDTQRGPAQASPAQSELAEFGGAPMTMPHRIAQALQPYAQAVVA